MELNIPDRIALLGILPRQGSIVTLRIVQELRTALSFSEGELEKWKINNEKVEGGTIVTWDEDFANETKDIEIGRVANTVIRQTLTKLSRENKLRVDAIPLYETFVEEKTEEKA